ncbi:centrosomal protein of 55 kDa-like isoform X2 [Amblyraja radiata]|uniref:centrosomal protein of 55 kDa-like isoform X2 n=1 Tax=Amblyraja radiata TaxID=386614 RepID=UPI001403AF11|nr:centrosomal protein of 55 kDa-like isoform X2 [Amblyraja radiata]
MSEKMRKASGSLLKKSNLPLNARKWSADPLASIETEYIKNLRQQICLLELETSFLRQQAKKAASIPPQIAQEAEKMLKEMKELQAEIELIQLEIRKRDTRIATSKSEKELFYRNLCSAQESRSREKKLLMEELVQIKKLKEIANQDITYKESELVNIKQELERTTAQANDEIHQVYLLETQLNQHVEKHQATEVQLGEKKLELFNAQVALRQCEEKFYTSTVSMQDHIARELRNEINSLQQKLRDQEVLAEEDTFLRNKEADDCCRLIKENSILHSQAQAARDQKNSQRSNSIAQLTSLKENERQLELELVYLKRVIEEEEKKAVNALKQLQHLEQGKSSVELNRQSLQNQLITLDKHLSSIKLENSQLKTEKTSLVEYISELHKQNSEKDVEILRMKGYIHTLAQDLGSLKSQLKAESSLRSESCKEISCIADTMKQVANTMTRRNNRNTTILNFSK